MSILSVCCPTTIIQFPLSRAKRVGEYAIAYFGNCPLCERAPQYVNVRKAHANLCVHCKVFWWIGENLFSSYQGESEADWRRNAAMLDTFRQVEPLHIPFPNRRATSRASNCQCRSMSTPGSEPANI